MNALARSHPQAQPVTQRPSRATKLRSRHYSSRKRNHNRALALEATTVLGFNALLIGVGLYTLTQLVPHQLTQQAKLREMHLEVNRVSDHIHQLEQSYARSLTASGTARVVEEQGHLIHHKKKDIVWVKKPG